MESVGVQERWEVNETFIGWMLRANAVVQVAVWLLQRKVSRLIDKRIDVSNERHDIATQRIDTLSNASVTHSKCCVQLLNGFSDLERRLSLLETDGK